MKIYMIQSRVYDSIRGLWTDIDDMVAYIARRCPNLNIGDYDTDLEEFMKSHWVFEYEANNPNKSRRLVDWSEFFPTE